MRVISRWTPTFLKRGTEAQPGRPGRLVRSAAAARSTRSIRLVVGLAIALVLLSGALKAWRFTLPFEGWRTTTDFQNDEPVFEKNLLGLPSDLQAGDRLVAVERVPFLDLARHAVAGRRTQLENYRAGQTVHYTVLREGEELELDVPLRAGTSLGFATIIRQFFTGNAMAEVAGWLSLLVVLFVFWRRPQHLTAQLLFLQAMATLASAISWTVTPLGVADTLNPATFHAAAFFTHWIHLTVEQPLALHIILSFPKPSPILQKHWVLPLLYGLPPLVLALALSGVPVSPFMVVALYGFLGIIAAVRLIISVRNPMETAQVRWFALGFAIANLSLINFGLISVGLVPGHFANLVDALPLQLIYVLCLVIAILRYRLFDINVILNRALVYGGLTAGVVGLYAFVVGGLGQLLPFQNNLALSLVATGFIAALFNPLRQYLQRAANRLLYGQRDEPYEVLSKLSRKVEDTLEPAKVLPTITETIAQVLKLPYAGVVLTRGGTLDLVASHGEPRGEVVALPLVHQGETVGELRLEPRTGETFSAAELRLLKTIAQQASVAAYAVKQNLDLQRSREALVTAREEERLRIRRDLHDGLGPELASLTLRLDAARNLLRYDTEQADALLLELKGQSQEALASIRRLVYALRPPALDELGLAGALCEEARKYDAVLNLTLETTGLEDLPAAVEVACYRIVQEALTNVVRHAQATRCSVRVHAGTSLAIMMEDNGVGLSESMHAGVGLRSMRERAEELGGTFKLEAGNGGGVRLSVALPL